MNSYIIVIGVGPGLGLALANKFYKKGLDICLVARNIEKLNAYAEEITVSKGNVFAYEGDAGDQNSLGLAMDRILSKHGTPALLIYNVSLLRPAAPSKISYDSFIKDFEINVAGMLTSYQKVIAPMKKNKRGKILVTGGGLALNPFHEFASLGVGKAGLRNLVGSLAQESAEWGIETYTITINGMIEPGTKFDPDLIANKFWDVYENGLTQNNHEVIYE